MDHIDPLDERLARDAGWLRGLARRLLDDEEDLLQDAALARLSKGSARAAAPRALLLNLARKAYRKEGRRRWREHRAATAHGAREAEATDRIVERSETASALLEEVRALRTAHRAVLIVHYFEGLSVDEIARTSGASPAAVRQRLVRARAALRSRLEARWGPDRNWRGALSVLCLRPGSTQSITVSLAPVFAGTLTMKLIVALCVCALAAVLAWTWSDSHEPAPATTRTRASTAEASLGPPQDRVAAVEATRQEAGSNGQPISRRAGELYPLVSPRPADVTGRVLRHDIAGEPVPVVGAELRALIRPFGRPWPATTVDVPLATVTDQKGRFRMTVDAFQDGTIELRANGLATLFLELDSVAPEDAYAVDDDLDQDLGDIVMSPGHGVSGVVVSPTGAPLASAQIRRIRTPGGLQIWHWEEAFLKHRPADAITDGNGRFTLDGLDAQDEPLRVSCQGFHDARVQGSEGALTVILEPSSTISGHVTGPLRDAAVPLGVIAWVDDEGFTVTEDVGAFSPVHEDGTFEISGIVRGQPYLLQAISDAVPSMASEPVSHRMEVRGGDEGVQVETIAGASMSARFVGPDGRSLTDLDLTAGFDHTSMHSQPLFRSPLLARPFDSGVLRLHRIVPHRAGQALHVEVSADGHEPWVSEVGPFTPGEHLDLGTIIMPLRVAQFPLRAQATLILVDGEGQPLPGVKVERTVADDAASANVPARLRRRAALTTDAAGRIEMTDLPAGVFRFQPALGRGIHLPDPDRMNALGVSVPQQRSTTLRITDPPDGDQVIRLVAAESGPLRVAIAREGTPIDGGRLSLVPGHDTGLVASLTMGLGSPPERSFLDLEPGGVRLYERLPFGPWTAVHLGAEGAWSCATFTHGPGRSDATLDVTGQVVSGRIVGRDGAPLSNAYVRFRRAAYSLAEYEHWVTRDIAWSIRHGRRGVPDLPTTGRPATHSDSNGRFTLAVPLLGDPSRWRLFVSHGDHASAEVSWGLGPTGAVEDIGDVALVGGGEVVVTEVGVVGIATWALEAVEVSGDPAWSCQLLNGAVNPRFRRVPPGLHRLVGLSADDRRVHTQPVTVSTATVTRVSVE